MIVVISCTINIFAFVHIILTNYTLAAKRPLNNTFRMWQAGPRDRWPF